MRITFDQAWENTRELNLQYCKASMEYRGKRIYANFHEGEFDVLRRYPKEEGAPLTRAERTEYRDAYCWVCERIIDDNK